MSVPEGVPERIGVVGAGTMGAGIAQLACLAGCETHLHDPVTEALEAGAATVRQGLEKGASRGRWSAAEATAAAGHLHLEPELSGLAGCAVVIEAAPERLELKRELFKELAAICGDEAILASNTSSIRISEIAAPVPVPQRVCGMHFFNPPPLMRLVEVIAGEQSSEAALETVAALARAMGREPVRAADAIGFIANRVNRPFSLEALAALEAGVSEVDQIDRIVRIGGGYRMGPFELQDLIGVDVNFAVAESFYEQSGGEPRWLPSERQREVVDAGHLGRKNGEGWYPYEYGPHRPDDPPPLEMRPASNPVDAVIEGEGFTGYDLLRTALPTEADAVGFVALPDVERARLVEIVRPEGVTEAAAVSAAGRHFAALGKHVECVLAPAPGLVLGRIVAQLVNEAHFALDEGVAEPDAIDTAVRLGLNHPKGPFEWLDQVGAEPLVRTLDRLADRDPGGRYEVSPALRSKGQG